MRGSDDEETQRRVDHGLMLHAVDTHRPLLTLSWHPAEDHAGNVGLALAVATPSNAQLPREVGVALLRRALEDLESGAASWPV